MPSTALVIGTSVRSRSSRRLRLRSPRVRPVALDTGRPPRCVGFQARSLHQEDVPQSPPDAPFLRHWATYYRFGRAVRGAMVEVGQDIGPAPLQGPAELGELLEPGGQPGPEVIDHAG